MLLPTEPWLHHSLFASSGAGRQDLAMHIAASNPQVIKPEEVSPELIAQEKEIFLQIDWPSMKFFKTKVQRKDCTKVWYSIWNIQVRDTLSINT